MAPQRIDRPSRAPPALHCTAPHCTTLCPSFPLLRSTPALSGLPHLPHALSHRSLTTVRPPRLPRAPTIPPSALHDLLHYLAVENKLYIFGGIVNDRMRYGDTHIFDTEAPDPPEPHLH